jgi:Amt family ammonium transporter
LSTCPASLIIGLVAGILGFIFVAKTQAQTWVRRFSGCFGVHGICGIWGALATGIFANPAINEAGAGLLLRQPRTGVDPGSLHSWASRLFRSRHLHCAMVTRVITGGIRIDKESEIEGQDNAFHGERGFEM